MLAAPETVAPPSLVPDEPADEHDRLAGEIAIGTWLEFTGENGVKQRLKIAWRSNTTGNCVFVDRRGLKATEKTQRGLAAELRRRSATVLDELPLMDRALEAMVQALKKTAA